jgi:hypothetical protein
VEKKEKKKKNMPFVENNVVKVNFLDFQPIYFPCWSSQMTNSFLYRVFGQGGSNGVLFDLTPFLGAMGFLFLNIGRDCLLLGC